jgi:hypothetical protein
MKLKDNEDFNCAENVSLLVREPTAMACPCGNESCEALETKTQVW